MKKFLCLAIYILLLCFTMTACGSVESSSKYQELQAEFEAAQSEAETANSQIDNYKEQISSLEKEKNELTAQVSMLNEQVEEAAPWFELSEMEKQAKEKEIQAEKEAKVAEEKAASDKAVAEAEAKEKQGYNTGITYDQLARTPDDYIGEKIKFYGKVIQVLEGSGTVAIRMATSGNYDNVIIGSYSSDIVSSRVLEDDRITIYGLSNGLYSYEATGGATITIPSVLIEKIDQ